MIDIELDNKPLTVPDGSTLADVLKHAETPYRDTTIAIIKGTEESKEATAEYLISTTKGDIGIELSAYQDIWRDAESGIINSGVRWAGRDALDRSKQVSAHPTGTTNMCGGTCSLAQAAMLPTIHTWSYRNNCTPLHTEHRWMAAFLEESLAGGV
jgi:hypothetical protein